MCNTKGANSVVEANDYYIVFQKIIWAVYALVALPKFEATTVNEYHDR